jgi:hypothetical protein
MAVGASQCKVQYIYPHWPWVFSVVLRYPFARESYLVENYPYLWHLDRHLGTLQFFEDLTYIFDGFSSPSDTSLLTLLQIQ